MQAKFHSAMAVIAERSEVRVGDRVWVKDTLGPERGCRGTVGRIARMELTLNFLYRLDSMVL